MLSALLPSLPRRFFHPHWALALGLGVVLLGPTPLSWGRWMKPEEADFTILEETIDIKVNEEGSYDFNKITKIRINNEKGRSEGTQTITYDPQSEKVKLKRAEIETKGLKTKVRDQDIMDSLVSTNTTGFQQDRQLLISFPGVQPGSVLTMELSIKVFKPLLDKHFFYEKIPGNKAPTEKFSLHIDSARKLFVEIKDKDQNLTHQIEEHSGRHVYDFKNRQTIFYNIVNESQAIFPENSISQILVSTAPDQIELYQSLSKPYEEILQSPTPESLKGLLAEAQKISGQKDQLSFVMKSLSEKIRYMGDWRNGEQAFIPHPLATIAERGFGDCKDMATTLTHLLRALGYEASVALLNRGYTFLQLPTVGVSYANHAITAVKDKEHPGHFLWLDPTNFQSFVDGVFEDIAERNAVLMTLPKPTLTYVSFHDKKMNTSTFRYQSFLKNNQWTIKNEIQLSGTPGLDLAGKALEHSKERLERMIIEDYITGTPPISYAFEPYDLSNRVLTPLDIKAQVVIPASLKLTSHGAAIVLMTPGLLNSLRSIDIKERVGTFRLGVPGTRMGEDSYPNLTSAGEIPLNCSFKSPWVDFEFKVKKGKGFKSTYRLETKKYAITAAEIHSEAFQKFQKEVARCSRDRLVVIKGVQ